MTHQIHACFVLSPDEKEVWFEYTNPFSSFYQVKMSLSYRARKSSKRIKQHIAAIIRHDIMHYAAKYELRDKCVIFFNDEKERF